MKRWKALRSLVVGGRRPSSTSAAERLIETHYATVYNLAYRTLGHRQDAEDITQQTFLRALPRLDELDGQDAAGWLCRVAANLCIDELRRGKRRHSADQLVDEVSDELASPVAFGSPEATLEQRELRLAVWRATLALPPQQRLALALREWHGMSYTQIASALATSVSAVETLLFRARQGFRRAYEQRLTQPLVDDAGCAWCLDRLSASVDGELSVAERRRVDNHVERCPTCRFAANELGTTSRLYAFLPLFVPALPAKAALLSAISGIGAAGAGAVLQAAGAGAVDAAASHASGGLTEIGSAATVAGAAGVAGASVATSGAVGAGAAGAVGSTAVSSVAASSAVGGAAGALGAAKSGVAIVAVAAAIGTAVWSGSQPEVPAPLADESAVVSQAPAALASLEVGPGLTSHASWTPPSAVSIENDATDTEAAQPVEAEEVPAPLLMTIAQPAQVANANPPQAAAPDRSDRQRQAQDLPAAEREKNQQEQSAEHDGSSEARADTDHRNPDEHAPQASRQADRHSQAEDAPQTRNRELVEASSRQSTEADDDRSEHAGVSESTHATADQPEPHGGDDESSTRLPSVRVAQVVDRSESAKDEQGPAQRQVSVPAAAIMATPEQHHAERNDSGDDNKAEDHQLRSSPQSAAAPQQITPIRPRPTQAAAPKRVDDHEPRQAHSERDTPDSGD